MPPKTPAKDDDQSRVYPNLEKFLEKNGRDAACKAFAGTREKLNELVKGAKGAPARKALVALDRTEALMTHLFDVKERLAEQGNKPAKSKR